MLTKALNQDSIHFNIIYSDFNTKIGIKIYPPEFSLGKFNSPGGNQRGETTELSLEEQLIPNE